LVTIDDVRAVAAPLPRSYEVVVGGRVKFRVGRIVYLSFSRDETLMGFAFPKEEREWLIGGSPEKFLHPSRSDLRYHCLLARMVVAASVAASAVALLLALTSGALTLALVIVALSVARSPMMLLDPIALRRLLTTRRTDYARIRLRMSAGWAASAIGSGAVFQT